MTAVAKALGMRGWWVSLCAKLRGKNRQSGQIRRAVIYRGETYLRAKDLGADPNSNVVIQPIANANLPLLPDGFGK